ncbi:MAG: single-stranded DNA-binding protein [Defluviitaleaceae bacterium]|nr:single-stranded DNA-binding protein [Defluviitaleaceae bacterium]
MNNTTLMGRLTKDPEVHYTNSAEPKAVCRYTLAVDRQISREKREAGVKAADFILCICFGKNAEFVGKHFRKGQMVSIVGRIQVRHYDDREGVRRWVMEIITEKHYFAESRASSESRSDNKNNVAPTQNGCRNSVPTQNQGSNQGDAQTESQDSPQQAQHEQPHHDPYDSFYEIDFDIDDEDLPY